MENMNALTQSGGLFPSSVGSVVDVATPATRKLRALGLLWALITLFPIVIINYVIIEALTSEDPMFSTSHPVHLLGSLLMPFLAWFALGSAVQRFHAAATKGRFFRSGPGGISVCLPDDATSATFLFSFRTFKFDLRWDEIKTWYPYVYSVNGIPVERSIVFETLKARRSRSTPIISPKNRRRLPKESQGLDPCL